MGKLAQATSKYTVIAKFTANGTIEKPDVIGAVFGQTEGLLGPDMDLRELQQTGRLGRIDVNITVKSGKSMGEIIIPSSLDSSETSLIAACIETIERVGPCTAKIRVKNIEDVRTEKRKYVIERAKELLSSLFEESHLESKEITEQIKEAVRTSEISKYRGLPAGPNFDSYDSIIIVEGRADILNLLKHGIKNLIALEGSSVPKVISEISKRKEVTAFLDGDRGGDLELKELLATSDIDFVARAPNGREVEELTKKEIFKALREKLPADQFKRETNGNGNNQTSRTVIKKYEQPSKASPRPLPSIKKEKIDQRKKQEFKKIINNLTGTRAAFFLDENNEVQAKVPVREMFNTMKEVDANALLFDGEIDQKLITFCIQRNVKYIVGMKIGRVNIPENIKVLTMRDL